MKVLFFQIFCVFLLLSCKNETARDGGNWEIISENLKYRAVEDTLELKSGTFTFEIPASELPYQKVILLNASLVGYFTELGMEDRITGISSPEYVFSPAIREKIARNKIHNIGNEQKYDVEKIIALKPQVILTNYVANFENTYEILRRNGIRIIFLNEYEEQNPLEKSAYLKVFGVLLGAGEKAEERFAEISAEYNKLRELAATAATKPVVLANEMYGNQWFMPGGRTGLARFLADAHAEYIHADNNDDRAVPMSFEEVYVKAQDAEFWVNAGNHPSRKNMLQLNPNYEKLEVFRNGKMYAVTGREVGKSNDFFESGVVRTDLILKDYIKIFHPTLLPDYNLTYMKELK